MNTFKKAQALYDNAGLPDDYELSDRACGAITAIASDLDLSDVIDAIACEVENRFSVSLSECVLFGISEKISELIESELTDAIKQIKKAQEPDYD